ncbi:MAG: sulfotransferase [Bacteroides sp.]|nr:sulfotransferase [Bacteroides sp.]
MKIFTIILGIRFSVLMRLIFRNGISLYPIYLARFMMLLMNSLISSVLILAEKKNYGKKIRETSITLAPVFIIGHWRTGSTLLHQLFCLDPQFTAPTMVQTTIPDHFLFSTRYYLPILEKAMPKTRPMDNVPLSPLLGQEDEFALIRMGSESPLEKLIFPSGDAYFLNGYEHYIPSGKKLETWKKNLLTFYKKITLQEGKQIVSKNPYHTMRMELLAEMFPGAKFIHITRDPLIVVPSPIRMWDIVAEQNKLKRGWKSPSVSKTASVLRSYQDHVALCSQKLDNPIVEVRFEELELDTVGVLKRIYSDLDIPWSDSFEVAVNEFLWVNKGFEKNTYKLTKEEEKTIQSILQF